VKIAPAMRLLLRTGRWARREKLGPLERRPERRRPARVGGAVDQGARVSLLGSDAAEDVTPSLVEGVALPIHTLMITGLGVNLLDNQDLEALGETAARLNRWEFMLAINPMPVAARHGIPAQRARESSSSAF